MPALVSPEEEQMRELRVVGVDVDGTHVVCQDAESGDKYRIPADERLRAAARGDLSRLGQIEIEMESALRPREIQARIRAGATVAEVAAIAGVGVDKVERFAHPVLLERTRATELAAHAHPIRQDGPSVSTLGDSVAEGMTAFGQNPADAGWDAWKADDGYWVVQVAWHVGHSEHAAHWRFHPGSHGGTADPLDDLADELTHPEAIQPLRRLTPVSAPPPATVEIAEDGHEQVTLDANSLIGAQRTRQPDQQVPDRELSASFDEHGTYALEFDEPRTPDARADSATGHPREREVDTRPAVSPAARAGTRDSNALAAHTPDADTSDVNTVTRPPAPRTEADREPAHRALDRSPEHAPDVRTDDADRTVADRTDEAAESAPRRRKSKKPPVPAWEDVLLGVRSNTEQSS